MDKKQQVLDTVVKHVKENPIPVAAGLAGAAVSGVVLGTGIILSSVVGGIGYFVAKSKKK